MQIDWIHPSYRDLVIDELSHDTQLGRAFLRSKSVDGVILAVSSSGGAEGERELPFMNFQDSWELLQQRSLELAQTEPLHDVVRLIRTLTDALERGQTKASSTLRAVAKCCCDIWNSAKKPLTVEALSTYSEASTRLDDLLPFPDLGPTWQEAIGNWGQALAGLEKDGSRVDESRNLAMLYNFGELLKVIRDNEPRFIRHVSFPAMYEGEISRMFELAKQSLDLASRIGEWEMDSHSDKLVTFALVIENLLEIKQDTEGGSNLFNELIEAARELGEKAKRYDYRYRDEDEIEYEQHSTNKVNIEAIFDDL